jgi:hypothetical protein
MSILDAQGRGINIIADSVADMREIVQAVKNSIMAARGKFDHPRGDAADQRRQREREEAKRRLDAERPVDPFQPQHPRSCCVVS